MSDVLNQVSVDSDNGLKTFYLLKGDILSVKSDLLVISTHSNNKYNINGEVIDALKEKYKVEIALESDLYFYNKGIKIIYKNLKDDLQILIVQIPKKKLIKNGKEFFG